MTTEQIRTDQHRRERRERSAIISRLAIAAGLCGAAVLFVLLTVYLNGRARDQRVNHNTARITSLQHDLDVALTEAKALEGDVGVLKQQLRDNKITPAVPDRPPVVSPTATTTTTTLPRRSPSGPASTTTTTTTAPSTPRPNAPPTTQPSPTTTTTQPPQSPPTTSCVVLGLVCR